WISQAPWRSCLARCLSPCWRSASGASPSKASTASGRVP
ncbi:MAG: hypothetical protein AVDCRST_MAG77-3366, partial [uncultured Chloroflexi bacterium]